MSDLDLASLGFAIDTSQVAPAVQQLAALQQAAGQLSAAQQSVIDHSVRFQAETAKTTASTIQMRQVFQTTTGALDQLIQTMDAARMSIGQGGGAFAAFATARAQVEALGQSFGQTSTSMEAYYRQASQFGLTAQQTVLSLQRITDALNDQTAAGRAIRQTMLDAGASLQGLTPKDGEQALQRYVVAMRNVADSAEKYRSAQMVLGPVDPDTYAKLNDPDYIPLAQQRQRQMSQQWSREIGDVTRSTALSTRQGQKDDAEYADLAKVYNVDPNSPFGLGGKGAAEVAKGLGPMSDYATQGLRTQDGRLSALRWLRDHPNTDAARGAMTPDAILDMGWRQSWLGQENEHLNNGTFSANQGQINDDYATNTKGKRTFLGWNPSAWWQAQTDTWKNDLNLYTPHTPGPDTRPEDEQKRILEDNAVGNQINDVGDGDVLAHQQASQTMRRLDQFDPGDATKTPLLLGTFQKAYGSPEEGTDRYDQLRAAAQHNLDTALTPGAAQIDAGRASAWTLAQPRAQQGQAQRLLAFARDNGIPTADWAANPSAHTLGSLLAGPGPGGLSPAQLNSFKTVESQNGSNAVEDSNQSLSAQIDLQERLQSVVQFGSAAVQDAALRQSTYQQAMQKTNDETKAGMIANNAVAEAMLKRKTAGDQLIETMKQQTDAEGMLLGGKQAAGADPVARAQAATQAAIDDAFNQAKRANPQLDSAGYMAQKKKQLGFQAGNYADDQTASLTHELDLQKQLLGVAGQRADVAAKMQRDQGIEAQFTQAMADAKGSSDPAYWVKQVQAAIDKTKALKDEITQVNAEARLFQMGRDAGASADFTDAVRNARPQDRAQMQRMRPAMEAIAGTPGIVAPQDAWTQKAQSLNLMPLFQATAQKYNMPVGLLIELVGQESSFDPGATNGNAAGPGQFMPGTWAQFGTANPDDRKSFGAAIPAMGKYLDYLRSRNGGDLAASLLSVPGKGGHEGYGTLNGLDATNPAEATRLRALAGDPTATMQIGAATPAGAMMLDNTRRNIASGNALATQNEADQFRFQTQANPRIRNLLRQGETGQVALLRAGQVNPMDPLGAAHAQQAAGQRVATTREGFDESYAGSLHGLDQQITQNRQMADAYQLSAKAVNDLTIAEKVRAQGQAQALTTTQKAVLTQKEQLALTTQQDAALSHAVRQQGDQQSLTDVRIGLGPFASERKVGMAMATAQANQTIDNQYSDASDSWKEAYVASAQYGEKQKQILQDQAELNAGFHQIGDSIFNAFDQATVPGAKLKTIFGDLLKSIDDVVLKIAVQKPLENMFGDLFGNLFGGPTGGGGGGGNILTTLLSAGTTAATGVPMPAGGGYGIYATGGVLRPRALAGGGLIDRPTYIPLASGDVAYTGEQGTEAVMPLTRLANGNLGVATGGGGGGGHSIVVHAPVTIQGGSSQGGQMDPTTMRRTQKQFEEMARSAVVAVMADESRPGGAMYGR